MNKSKLDTFGLVCLFSIAITVAMTPWVSSDSLIIPKLIILFSSGLFLIPRILWGSTNLLKVPITKLVVLISTLIFIYSFIIFVVSSAPFEQQFFGRTGRGLGIATELSLIIFMLSACAFVKMSNLSKLLITLIISVFISSFYSILQRFGLDIFEWETRTNGIIGTLGNPNYQSSFAAMALIPVAIYFLDKPNGKIYSFLLISPLVAVLYISQSTQGYLASALAIFVLALVYFWYKNRLAFFTSLLIGSISGILAILGMLNKGPLSEYLYKYSVKSRGEFYRTAVSLINDNKLFGVGFDSIGDNYLKYRSLKDARGVGEFTDNMHNIYLNYASVGGIPFALLQGLIVIVALTSFIKIQKKIKRFDKNITAIFCSWVCYQSQALISPANISMLTWNAIITGSLIGLSSVDLQSASNINPKDEFKMQLTKPFSNFLLVIGFVIMLPLYNVDRMSLQASRTGDGLLALKAATSYPESTIRYSRIGQEFIKSNLAEQALEIGRAAAKFNPNAPSAWGLILVNNLAPREERLFAQKELLRLDPHNDEIRNLQIPNQVTP
jgi:hypothetical protein